jgi:spore coat protein U-like protein
MRPVRRLLGVLALLPLASALATTTTTTFQVTATVNATCAVSATNLAFGTYDPLSGTPSDATSTVNVTCTLTTPYNVGLDAGLGSGATVTTRKMTHSSDLLNYSLYQDAARTQVWGTTIGTNTATGTGTGLGQAFTVYGRIPAAQNVNLGSYADTVTVTVTY